MRVLLIYNTKAGDDNRGDDMLELVRAAGHEVTAVDKKADFDRYFADRPDLVAVAGGDGTVVKVARKLIWSDLPLTILPIGTANNIALSLGLDAEPGELVAAWERPHYRMVDALVARLDGEDHVTLESAGLGLFAEAMCQSMGREETEEKFTPEERFERDFRYLRRLAVGFQPQHCTVQVNGETFEDEILLCEVMNSRQIGSRVVFAPEADMTDGQLDLVLVTRRDRNLLREFLERGPLDTHLPHLPVRRGTDFVIRGTCPRIHVGDEMVELKDRDKAWELEVFIQHGAVRMLAGSAG